MVPLLARSRLPSKTPRSRLSSEGHSLLSSGLALPSPLELRFSGSSASACALVRAIHTTRTTRAVYGKQNQKIPVMLHEACALNRRVATNALQAHILVVKTEYRSVTILHRCQWAAKIVLMSLIDIRGEDKSDYHDLTLCRWDVSYLGTLARAYRINESFNIAVIQCTTMAPPWVTRMTGGCNNVDPMTSDIVMIWRSRTRGSASCVQ